MYNSYNSLWVKIHEAIIPNIFYSRVHKISGFFCWPLKIRQIFFSYYTTLKFKSNNFKRRKKFGRIGSWSNSESFYFFKLLEYWKWPSKLSYWKWHHISFVFFKGLKLKSTFFLILKKNTLMKRINCLSTTSECRYWFDYLIQELKIYKQICL